VIKVQELMTTDLITLEQTDSLSRARKLMAEQHIRHIPIVDGKNQFVGLLTQRDVLAASVSNLAEVEDAERDDIEAAIPIREIMTTDVTAVHEEMYLREAAQYLLDHKLGCLPVIAHGTVVGIITESDFLKLVINLIDRWEP